MDKVTKSQVKATIRNTGKWTGVMIGNKSNPNSPWISNASSTVESLEDLEKIVNGLLYYMPKELGTRVAFYQV